MSEAEVLRIGLVGVNTWHAEAFTDVLLAAGPAAHVEPVPQCRVTAVWGDPPEVRNALARKMGARPFGGDPAELIGHIDVAFVIDDAGGGSRHRELAEPFLRANVPVVIDKPMTLALSDADALFDLAANTGTPIMSCSALRFSQELRDHAPQLKAVGPIQTIDVSGPGEWYYYGIHAVELLLTMLPSPVAWVQRHTSEHRDVAVVGFADGRIATASVLRDAYYTFTASVYGSDGWVPLEIVRNYDFYRAYLAAGIEMARTGISPISRDQTMDVLRVLHAGLRSVEACRAVRLSELSE